jgi:hypothetical protein
MNSTVLIAQSPCTYTSTYARTHARGHSHDGESVAPVLPRIVTAVKSIPFTNPAGESETGEDIWIRRIYRLHRIIGRTRAGQNQGTFFL